MSADQPKREVKKKLEDMYFEIIDQPQFKALCDKVKQLEEVNEVKSALEAVLRHNEELTRELNQKDVTMNEMAAELSTLKTKTRDIGNCGRAGERTKESAAGK